MEEPKHVVKMEFPLYKKIASLAAVLALASTVAAQAQGTAVSSLQADLPVQTASSITATTNFNFAPIAAGPLTSTESATGSLSYVSSAVPASLTLSDTNGTAGFSLAPPAGSTGATPIPFSITGVDSEADPAITFLDGVASAGLGASAKASDTLTFTATLVPGTGNTAVAGTYTDTITATLTFV
jgi:spore coat protein U-like protein